uniref:Uncharacterized protein n=1 Tax=Setaria italica TaxID=4555 RepID=K4AGI4_SETIT
MPMLPPPLPFGRRRRTPGVYNKPVEPHWLPPYLFRFRLDNLFGAKVLQVFAVFGRGRQPVAATGGWSGGSSQHPKRRGCIRSGNARLLPLPSMPSTIWFFPHVQSWMGVRIWFCWLPFHGRKWMLRRRKRVRK